MGDSAEPTPEQTRAAERLKIKDAPARRAVAPWMLIATGVPSFFAGVIGTLVVYVLVLKAPPADEPPGATTTVGTSAQNGEPAPTAMRTGKTDAGPEGEARRALARFRDGIGTCVRDVISVLPGTSPAVPNAWALMKNGVYASAPSDYRTPVYSCAKYSETAPQPFQIQWQLGATPTEGLGVAWIDDDRDGKPDRAFGFTARLVKKKEVTFGEIGPLSPMPKVLPAR